MRFSTIAIPDTSFVCTISYSEEKQIPEVALMWQKSQVEEAPIPIRTKLCLPVNWREDRNYHDGFYAEQKNGKVQLPSTTPTFKGLLLDGMDTMIRAKIQALQTNSQSIQEKCAALESAINDFLQNEQRYIAQRLTQLKQDFKKLFPYEEKTSDSYIYLKQLIINTAFFFMRNTLRLSFTYKEFLNLHSESTALIISYPDQHKLWDTTFLSKPLLLRGLEDNINPLDIINLGSDDQSTHNLGILQGYTFLATYQSMRQFPITLKLQNNNHYRYSNIQTKYLYSEDIHCMNAASNKMAFNSLKGYGLWSDKRAALQKHSSNKHWLVEDQEGDDVSILANINACGGKLTRIILAKGAVDQKQNFADLEDKIVPRLQLQGRLTPDVKISIANENTVEALYQELKAHAESKNHAPITLWITAPFNIFLDLVKKLEDAGELHLLVHLIVRIYGSYNVRSLYKKLKFTCDAYNNILDTPENHQLIHALTLRLQKVFTNCAEVTGVQADSFLEAHGNREFHSQATPLYTNAVNKCKENNIYSAAPFIRAAARCINQHNLQRYPKKFREKSFWFKSESANEVKKLIDDFEENLKSVLNLSDQEIKDKLLPIITKLKTHLTDAATKDKKVIKIFRIITRIIENFSSQRVMADDLLLFDNPDYTDWVIKEKAPTYATCETEDFTPPSVDSKSEIKPQSYKIIKDENLGNFTRNVGKSVKDQDKKSIMLFDGNLIKHFNLDGPALKPHFEKFQQEVTKQYDVDSKPHDELGMDAKVRNLFAWSLMSSFGYYELEGDLLLRPDMVLNTAYEEALKLAQMYFTPKLTPEIKHATNAQGLLVNRSALLSSDTVESKTVPAFV